jgi:hypothetical protein
VNERNKGRIETLLVNLRSDYIRLAEFISKAPPESQTPELIQHLEETDKAIARLQAFTTIIYRLVDGAYDK